MGTLKQEVSYATCNLPSVYYKWDSYDMTKMFLHVKIIEVVLGHIVK